MPAYYVHLQDTYFAEKADVGTGDQISYKAPPDNVFKYDVSGAGVFKATSDQPLDECSKGGVWQVKGTAGSKTVSYARTVTGDNCEALTPNFTLIGEGS